MTELMIPHQLKSIRSVSSSRSERPVCSLHSNVSTEELLSVWTVQRNTRRVVVEYVLFLFSAEEAEMSGRMFVSVSRFTRPF